ATAVLARTTGAEPTVEPGAGRASVPIDQNARTIADTAAELAAAGIDLSGFTVRQPTLDEVFLDLTAHGAVAAPEPEGQAACAPLPPRHWHPYPGVRGGLPGPSATRPRSLPATCATSPASPKSWPWSASSRSSSCCCSATCSAAPSQCPAATTGSLSWPG